MSTRPAAALIASLALAATVSTPASVDALPQHAEVNGDNSIAADTCSSWLLLDHETRQGNFVYAAGGRTCDRFELHYLDLEVTRDGQLVAIGKTECVSDACSLNSDHVAYVSGSTWWPPSRTAGP